MRHVPIESVKRDRRLTMTPMLTTTMLAMTLAAVVAAGAGPATQPADARSGDGLAARVARLEAIVLHAPADATANSSANASANSSVELRLEALERKLSDRSASDRLGGDRSVNDRSGNDQASIANLQAAVSRLDEKEQAISRQVAALQGKGVGTPIGRAEPTMDQLRRDVDQMQRDLQDLRARVRQVEERQDRR